MSDSDEDSDYHQPDTVEGPSRTYTWGTEEASSQNTTGKLLERAKKVIKSRLQKTCPGLGSILMDLDAFSIVISTNEMTSHKRDAVRQFLLSFGKGTASGCNFPQMPIGKKRKDGMFGCCGTECQHLPIPLQGKEMMVIDSPIKIALHDSCREDMISSLLEKRLYFHPASKSSGLCFNPQAAANKPNYKILVDAIVESCQVKTEMNRPHIIHVAQLGCRFPVPDEAIDSLFQHCNDMTEKGLKVEIVQFDIAFTLPLPKEMLFQASCVRKPQHETGSVLRDTSVSVFPLHILPEFRDQKLSQKTLKGTFQIKKNNWSGENAGRPVSIGKDEKKEVEIFLQELGEDSVLVQDNIVHSIKLYSTIAHPLLQRRQKYPLSLADMFGIGRRTIESLQTLARNLKIATEETFGIVEDAGIGVRIEVSVRPHHDDPFRMKCHFNDILLIVCLALGEFCETFKPAVSAFPTRRLKTEALKLLSELTSMMNLRHNVQFNKMYTHQNMTAWLQSHLSHLLITIGLSPAYGIKFINSWLEDHDERFDPYGRARESSSQENDLIQSIQKRMENCLKNILQEFGFSPEGTSHLIDYIKIASPQKDARESFAALNLKEKLILAQKMWQEIIPGISQFLSKENNQIQSDKNESKKDTEGYRWWEQQDQEQVPDAILDKLVAEAPMPKHPLAFAIVALARMATLWYPQRYGFDRILCKYVLDCTKCQHLYQHSNLEESVANLLNGCHEGNVQITRDVLRRVCFALKLTTSQRANKSIVEYRHLLCQHFRFPWKDSLMKITRKRGDTKRNKILNAVLCSDMAITIAIHSSSTIFHRIAENRNIQILHRSELLSGIPWGEPSFPSTASCSDLCELICPILNSQSKACLCQTLHDQLTRLANLENKFLTSEGTNNSDFIGCSTLNKLEDKHHFSLHDKNTDTIPTVLCALICLVYEDHITLYDMTNRKTHFFLSMDSRSIKYECTGCNFIPRRKSLIIALNRDGTYDLMHTGANTPLGLNSQPSPPHIISVGPLGGRVRIMNRLDEIPNLRSPRGGQSFYKALSKILKELDPNYLVKDEQNMKGDPLGLFSFTEELACCSNPRYWQTAFANDVVEQCHLLRKPLKLLLSEMKNDPTWDQASHHLLCPITCLKHHHLIVGVFETFQKRKCTYFYSFNRETQKVECRKLPGKYYILTDRAETLYLYATEKTCKHFGPEAQTLDRNGRYINCFNGPYSHIEQSRLSEYLQDLKSSFDLDNLHVNNSKVDDHDFRPEPQQSTVLMTTVTSNSGTLPYLLSKGIPQKALIAIFTAPGDTNKWDACIVHHPLQCPSYSGKVLDDFLSNAPSHSSCYNRYLFKSRSIERCESGFYMLLYAYLGSKCSSLSQFENAMQRLGQEPDLKKKACRWAGQVVQREYSIPAWLAQMTWRGSPHPDLHSQIQTQRHRAGPQVVHHAPGPGQGQNMTSRKRTQPQLSASHDDTQQRGMRPVKTARQIYMSDLLGGHRTDDCAKAPGLLNPEGKNLCYINSIIQLFHAMKCTRDLFAGSFWPRLGPLTAQQFDDFMKKGGSIAMALRKMFHDMQYPHPLLSVEEFKKALVSSQGFQYLNNNSQHDAYELLVRLLETFSTALRSDTDDPISDLFRSSTRKRLQCQSCKRTTEKTESSTTIDLPITNPDLEECLSAFCEGGTVTRTCPYCSCTHSTEKLLYEQRPICIISLKRFRYEHGESAKIRDLVSFPLDGLDMSPMMIERHPNEITTHVYKLVAVINHIGESIETGHYNVTVRIRNKWYMYNDTQVVEIRAAHVTTKDAYTLVYCRCDRYQNLVA